MPKQKRSNKVLDRGPSVPSIEEVLRAPSLEDQHRLLTQEYREPIEIKAPSQILYVTRTFTTYSAYEDPI